MNAQTETQSITLEAATEAVAAIAEQYGAQSTTMTALLKTYQLTQSDRILDAEMRAALVARVMRDPNVESIARQAAELHALHRKALGLDKPEFTEAQSEAAADEIIALLHTPGRISCFQKLCSDAQVGLNRPPTEFDGVREKFITCMQKHGHAGLLNRARQLAATAEAREASAA